MNKKEILEIRKQFTPANCAITRICGCYVDHEKTKKMESKDAFLSLPEEEAFKYFDIFKKTLSGTVGKNMLNLEFPLDAEMPGGTQEFLMKLRDSKLEDDMLLEEFYDKVIATYDYAENYYIILIHAMYDIPGKSSDGLEMFDASDEVYEYLLMSICPVSLSKAGLSYNAEDNRIQDRIRDWIVDMPSKGFLFPAFNDRSTDLHSVLYYTKKSEDLQPEMIDQLLGAKMPMSADTQKETFQMIIEDTLGEDGDYETVRNIHETLNDLIEEHKEEPEPLALDKTEIKKIFEQSGVDAEKMESFDRNFEENAGEKASLLATNIAETRKFNIETPDVVIKVNPDRADLVETRIIDGRQCLVIPVDDHIEVNGINVRTIKMAGSASSGSSENGEDALSSDVL
ncbi:MAG TPA: DUF4317 domain-containing protein [Candidatus Mediterraneibacter tabaqchaliae]|uniref:DUF4317 domain-containing protein n=1 Tax=Candidatus Mediterraneibacter tabaqchaliae TaxID=2838689 RepID=A0A9D2R626_9FIRM|nr:DUF4317 domain-containing protein [Candidatus Mediterraneibacter tabaqchaliae]